ncbi:MAG: hypothetical protein AAGA85_18630 [Bacteroidota bacterium]
MKKIYLLMGCTLLCASIYAQSVSRNEDVLSLSLGYASGAFQDQVFSPLTYDIRGTAVGLGYTKHTRGGDQIVIHLDFVTSLLSSDRSDKHDTDNYQGILMANYLHHLNPGKGAWQFLAGGGFQSYLNASFFDGTESIAFLGLHAFNIAGKVTYDLSERHQFAAALQIPVFGQLVRPPYTGWNKFIQENEDTPLRIFTSGNWTSFQDFFGLNLALNYYYRLSDRWRLLMQYDTRFYRSSTTEITNILAANLRVGATFNI